MLRRHPLYRPSMRLRPEHSPTLFDPDNPELYPAVTEGVLSALFIPPSAAPAPPSQDQPNLSSSIPTKAPILLTRGGQSPSLRQRLRLAFKLSFQAALRFKARAYPPFIFYPDRGKTCTPTPISRYPTSTYRGHENRVGSPTLESTFLTHLNILSPEGVRSRFRFARLIAHLANGVPPPVPQPPPLQKHSTSELSDYKGPLFHRILVILRSCWGSVGHAADAVQVIRRAGAVLTRRQGAILHALSLHQGLHPPVIPYRAKHPGELLPRTPGVRSLGLTSAELVSLLELTPTQLPTVERDLVRLRALRLVTTLPVRGETAPYHGRHPHPPIHVLGSRSLLHPGSASRDVFRLLWLPRTYKTVPPLGTPTLLPPP